MIYSDISRCRALGVGLYFSPLLLASEVVMKITTAMFLANSRDCDAAPCQAVLLSFIISNMVTTASASNYLIDFRI